MLYHQEIANPFTTARFVKGIIGTDPIIQDRQRRHVAFIGRSNVGKSSIINAVLGRKSLVKSSARPGKTTEINFFSVDEDYYFVDLPGYGFARMGEKQRDKLRKLILWYLMYAEVSSRITFVLIDAQVGLGDFDRDVIRELQTQKEDVWVVANKIDKLNQKERHRLRINIEQEINQVVYTSATKQQGIATLRDIITGV